MKHRVLILLWTILSNSFIFHSVYSASSHRIFHSEPDECEKTFEHTVFIDHNRTITDIFRGVPEEIIIKHILWTKNITEAKEKRCTPADIAKFNKQVTQFINSMPEQDIRNIVTVIGRVQPYLHGSNLTHSEFAFYLKVAVIQQLVAHAKNDDTINKWPEENIFDKDQETDKP